MGTNYYVEKNNPPLDDLFTKTTSLHIGKSSGGWAFSLSVDVFKTYEDWLEFLSNNDLTITNEYGAILTLSELRDVIEKRNFIRRSPIDDTQHCVGHGPTYDLITGEFS